MAATKGRRDKVGFVMRFEWVPAPLRALAVVPAALILTGGSTEAAMPQIFPVKPNLVPILVAATFILPAAAAGVLSVLRRAGRAMGPVVSVGVLVVVAAALAVYADPLLIASLRI